MADLLEASHVEFLDAVRHVEFEWRMPLIISGISYIVLVVAASLALATGKERRVPGRRMRGGTKKKTSSSH